MLHTCLVFNSNTSRNSRSYLLRIATLSVSSATRASSASWPAYSTVARQKRHLWTRRNARRRRRCVQSSRARAFAPTPALPRRIRTPKRTQPPITPERSSSKALASEAAAARSSSCWAPRSSTRQSRSVGRHRVARTPRTTPFSSRSPNAAASHGSGWRADTCRARDTSRRGPRIWTLPPRGSSGSASTETSRAHLWCWAPRSSRSPAARSLLWTLTHRQPKGLSRCRPSATRAVARCRGALRASRPPTCWTVPRRSSPTAPRIARRKFSSCYRLIRYLLRQNFTYRSVHRQCILNVNFVQRQTLLP